MFTEKKKREATVAATALSHAVVEQLNAGYVSITVNKYTGVINVRRH